MTHPESSRFLTRHEKGGPTGVSVAAKWFRRAAGAGHAEARFKLGSMYAKGEGVSQDYTEAAKWYRKAAEQGNAKAQFMLGAMYNDGRGIPQNYLQAHMWLNLAAAQGEKRGAEGRNDIAKKMTPA